MKNLEQINADNLRNLGKGQGVMVDTRPLVFYTLYQCGYSYEDIGKIFGLSRQRVHYTIKHALGDK